MIELRWAIVAFIVLWMMWAATDGPSRIENRNRQLLQQPADGGKAYSLEQLQEGTRP